MVLDQDYVITCYILTRVKIKNPTRNEKNMEQRYRGYYTVARRYEFYVRVARTISHE